MDKERVTLFIEILGIVIATLACIAAYIALIPEDLRWPFGKSTTATQVSSTSTISPTPIPSTNTSVPPTAIPTLSSIPGGVITVIIVSQLTNRCLDVPYGTSNDTWIGQYGCHGNINQQWQLVSVKARFYLIQAKVSNKCLNVPDGSLDDGVGVFQARCHGGDNQKWQLIPTEGRAFQIMAKHSGKCLDIRDGLKDDGPAIQYTCHEGDSQKWFLQEVPTK